ncbi:hypothetical protein M0638_22930 [Roseomonas sp. NAR14]|uniref:Uncharacterized protein n=1 Tax=Roseomonas acroporae TaxID=2937791 RepID=A0A9X1YEK9_9PROT|nr:hypothetical protein [Roseomonas acroporae]MCK8787232.1 hypothetical protein [Roseomonas acroporae]
MSGKPRDWEAKGRRDLIPARAAEREALRAAEVRERLVRISKPHQAATALPPRPPGGYGSGISCPLATPLRYARTTGTGEELVLSEAGRSLIEALFSSMDDRRDRTVLAWPNRPEGAFVAAAIALHEGRATGRLGRAAVALWPWRDSATVHAARSILVESQDLIAVARAAAKDVQDDKEWSRQPDAQDTLNVVHFSLRGAKRRGRWTVSRPNLLEITPTFGPHSVEPHYRTDPAQVLYRVREHTRIADMGAACANANLGRLGDPSKAPLAVFGLPPAAERDVARCLAFPRFANLGLDAILVDATRRIRDELGDRWERGLVALLGALDRMGTARPGVVALADDAFGLRVVEEALRKRAQAVRPQRRPLERRGMLLVQRSLLGPASSPALQTLPEVEYRFDLKDGTLLATRRALLGLAQRAEREGDADAANGARAALAFIRSIANLPVGYDEAMRIVWANHASDDELDLRMRRRLGLDTALIPLHDAWSARDGAFKVELDEVRKEVQRRIDGWRKATPMSLKLRGVLSKAKRDGKDPLLALPGSDSLSLFSASSLADEFPCRAVETRRLADAVAAHETPLVIVVGPSPETVRLLLTLDPSPPKVALVGDAAGSALLAAELYPLTRTANFAPVAARATAMLRELGKVEADLSEDMAETRAPPLPDLMNLDFTREGGRYEGAVVRVVTEGGYSIAYRKGSDVLRQTPDELRCFERARAADLRRGDSILVLVPRLLEQFREAFARSPGAQRELRAYHEAVARCCASLPGRTHRDHAWEVLHRIQRADPTFGDFEIDNVVRWVRVDGNTLDDPGAQPQTPRTWARFSRFTQVLGMSPALAEAYWRAAIRPARSFRISEGMMFHERAVAFVADPEGVMARPGARDLAPLWQAILENVDTVRTVEAVNAADRA